MRGNESSYIVSYVVPSQWLWFGSHRCNQKINIGSGPEKLGTGD